MVLITKNSLLLTNCFHFYILYLQKSLPLFLKIRKHISCYYTKRCPFFQDFIKISPYEPILALFFCLIYNYKTDNLRIKNAHVLIFKINSDIIGLKFDKIYHFFHLFYHYLLTKEFQKIERTVRVCPIPK